VQDVCDRLDELRVGGDWTRPESVAEEVSPAAVFEIERLRVVAVEKLHSVGELLASRFDDEVIVVAHETEGVAAPLVLGSGESQEEEEEMPVVVVEEDRYPSGAARADVEDPLIRQVGARSPSHAVDRSGAQPRPFSCGAIATLPRHPHAPETAMAGTVPDMAPAATAGRCTDLFGSTVST
jgi:hypothetical protein